MFRHGHRVNALRVGVAHVACCTALVVASTANTIGRDVEVWIARSTRRSNGREVRVGGATAPRRFVNDAGHRDDENEQRRHERRCGSREHGLTHDDVVWSSTRDDSWTVIKNNLKLRFFLDFVN